MEQGPVRPPLSSDERNGWNDSGETQPLTLKKYLVGVFVLLAASYSQYFIPHVGLVGGVFLVYGVSILVMGDYYGKALLRKAFRRSAAALETGMGLLGLFTVVSTVFSFLLVALLLDVAPGSLNALHKPVPVLHISPRLAWVMVGASLVVVGPCEEFIFRGFVFGGLLALFGSRRRLLWAFLSSLLFAAIHLYYALTYGIASVMPFFDILALGMALALTYYHSGGNLVAPALIHGLYDATGFMGVAVNHEVGALLRGTLMFAGVVTAATMLIRRHRNRVRR